MAAIVTKVLAPWYEGLTILVSYGGNYAMAQ